MAVSSPCSPASDYVENGGDSHENPAVTLFREYLRIPSVSRGEDYQEHYGEVMLVCVRRVFDLGWKLNDRLKFVYGLSSGCLGLKHPPWSEGKQGTLMHACTCTGVVTTIDSIEAAVTGVTICDPQKYAVTRDRAPNCL